MQMAKRTAPPRGKSAGQEPAADMTAPEIQERFGRRVRAARIDAGLTQIQVSELAGIAQRTLSEIERGKTNCSLGLAERLAKVLDHRIDHLVAPVSGKPSKQ
jgi:DNA-binding XRE family transcriptional regulator